MAVAEIYLDGRPSSIRTARQWAVKHARDAEASPGVVKVVELLTSELAANALAHGRAEPVLVRVGVIGDQYVVRVTDEGDTLPVVRDDGPRVPGGQGLRLVERLASDWGVDVHPRGKTVWFAVALDATTPLG
ncbi:ATP-binding protein [Actinotalea solisilvae]|uniref:ATP-binding protein n=1 Tax=Actinotalea solisilvae TaxID=2072922 RepID=UPI0018F138B6|nr:ATP-binding protein [Actinotalea solisilvae]